MYYYHVWETRHPLLTNGEPLYETTIWSSFPIETKEQIMNNLRENSIWWEIQKNKDFEVVEMSRKEFLFELITDAWFEFERDFCEFFEEKVAFFRKVWYNKYMIKKERGK